MIVNMYIPCDSYACVLSIILFTDDWEWMTGGDSFKSWLSAGDILLVLIVPAWIGLRSECSWSTSSSCIDDVAGSTVDSAAHKILDWLITTLASCVFKDRLAGFFRVCASSIAQPWQCRWLIGLAVIGLRMRVTWLWCDTVLVTLFDGRECAFPILEFWLLCTCMLQDKCSPLLGVYESSGAVWEE